jgi:hypothetical protein
MSEILDEVFQRKMSIKLFFESAGWKIYEEKLKDLIEVEDCAIQKLMQEAISDASIQQLNFSLGKKKALEGVSCIKDELQEELEEENSSTPT